MFLHTKPNAVEPQILSSSDSRVSVSDFEAAYPQYAFNFGAPLKIQPRIYDSSELSALLPELYPIALLARSTKKNPNRNQTKTHSQCKRCGLVLRNDLFPLPPSAQEQNIIHSYCDKCARQRGQDYYSGRAEKIASRRVIVWKYLAPRCAICGFDKSIHALDMHHVGNKDFRIAELITLVCNPSEILFSSVERLVAEAGRCVPLCANCHRMVHSGEAALAGAQPLHYDPLRLVALLREYDKPFQYSLMEAA
jgi:ribosomal protein L37E